ncbi:UNVERIFIED_CONTAM: thiol-disulfide oxidoreductase DCC family protein [Halobacillus marinus]|uniref:thiol-disulfide oxidoreductase DCC family protein n=1 Tax=Halobacillus sp. KGW1 TaxID=1793726 RepID=UPI00128FD91E|nr:thiol-disulfide oxidoreductase DCC family protein [Halobacillus sp. KGW1]
MAMIVLFDGDCNFCDQSVQFIIKRDTKAHFRFASQQSDTGRRLMAEHNVSEDLDSLILIDGSKAFDQSGAALRIAGKLNGGWKLAYGLLLIPKPLRDLVYKYIAKNRYRWFGKKEACTIPSPEIRQRFL